MARADRSAHRQENAVGQCANMERWNFTVPRRARDFPPVPGNDHAYSWFRGLSQKEITVNRPPLEYRFAQIIFLPLRQQPPCRRALALPASGMSSAARRGPRIVVRGRRARRTGRRFLLLLPRWQDDEVDEALLRRHRLCPRRCERRGREPRPEGVLQRPLHVHGAACGAA